MSLSDIFIYALKKLDGFTEENILKAIDLANNDVVETLDDFIDFINFNIEDNRFANITHPFKESLIKKAVEKAIINEDNIVHYANATDERFPKKIFSEQVEGISLLKYKGNLDNLNRKTILITGSPTVSGDARLASEYIGKVLAINGYNILSTLSNECEQNAIKGCKVAMGISTFYLPHSVEHLTNKEKDVIQHELDTNRSLIISADDNTLANIKTRENAYKYATAFADCMILPQISSDDYLMGYVETYMALDKPVFLVKYKSKSNKEYDCIRKLESLGVMYLSSDTIYKQIKDTIGTAIVDDPDELTLV